MSKTLALEVEALAYLLDSLLKLHVSKVGKMFYTLFVKKSDKSK